jgi:hypothetical protein
MTVLSEHFKSSFDCPAERDSGVWLKIGSVVTKSDRWQSTLRGLVGTVLTSITQPVLLSMPLGLQIKTAGGVLCGALVDEVGFYTHYACR